MGRPKKVQSPHLSVFSLNNHKTAEALERERTVRSQIDHGENIIVWGSENNLPLRILQAVNESPTTTSCLGTVENFIKGSRFADEELMSFPINKDGETLWDLHCKLSQYMALLEGFSLQFTYDNARRIINAYVIGVESCRFVNPPDGSRDITKIKYNPYFGTSEYKQSYTCEYDVFNLETISEGIKEKGLNYNGQIYFYGRVRPMYRFYPVPKYWSGENWIYVDGQIQVFHKQNLDNGFFQSVWMQVVGNPDLPSQNPEFNRTETGTDGVKIKIVSKTVGQEFDDRMSQMFSGVKKAGTAFVSWVASKEDGLDIQTFPVNSNFDVLSGTLTDAIRGVTIATEVPAILANLPQQASSLGSDGNAMKAAIELMQSRVSDKQQILENFYNKVLIPNLAKKPKTKEVKIVNFVPISTPVDVQQKFWDIVPQPDKISFINEHVPGLQITEEAPPAPVVDPVTGETVQPVKPNENLKNIGLQDWDRIAGLRTRFINGKITQQDVEGSLLSYGFTKAEIDQWLAATQTA